MPDFISLPYCFIFWILRLPLEVMFSFFNTKLSNFSGHGPASVFIAQVLYLKRPWLPGDKSRMSGKIQYGHCGEEGHTA
jgi:hypothetical protein